MTILREVTLDKLINLYEGHVVTDRKQLAMAHNSHDGGAMESMRERVLAQDKMILSALKYAKANGFTGEE